ncbi:MAG: hypothetical protein H6760_00705 [Candidatus Nomurabacteria bacterium]|nr:MAG: hypothetical protein H6760_00705 [Candidatus Nomurabacteria bacterium]
MIDLATINASTIAQPKTLEAVRAEVDDVVSLGDVSRAGVLLSYLQRQLPQSPNDPIRNNYQEILQSLERLVGEANPADDALISEERTRVAVRDSSGKVQLFSHGRFQSPEEQKQQLRERPSTPPSFRKSIGNVQNSTESRAAQKSVPVSFDVPEDEEEIREHTNRLSGLRLNDQHNYEAMVESIISHHHLEFPDEQLAKRFSTIAISRLKGIRDDKEAKEIFTRSPKVGGMGLAPELADAVLQSLESGAEVLDESLPEVHPQQKAHVPTPTPPAPSRVLPHLANQPTKVMAHQAIPTPPRTQTPAATSSESRKVLPKRQTVQASGRPTLDDIKSPSRRLVGPVEELQHLSLEDFRNWGSTPADSVRKVYEKIAVLGQESFGKRIEGVQAWRQSPVHQLYLSISRESLEKGTDVSKVISERTQQNKASLSEAEFHAVVDLNTKLRF